MMSGMAAIAPRMAWSRRHYETRYTMQWGFGSDLGKEFLSAFTRFPRGFEHSLHGPNRRVSVQGAVPLGVNEPDGTLVSAVLAQLPPTALLAVHVRRPTTAVFSSVLIITADCKLSAPYTSIVLPTRRGPML